MSFRTPVPQWSQVNFIENGELGDKDTFNRPHIALDDKAQYLRENLETEIAASSRLAELVGEDYRVDCDGGFPNQPCWTNHINFGEHDSHRSAIEALDVAVGASETRVSTLEFQVGNLAIDIGEDPNDPAFPDWFATRTPFVLQLNDTHHQAIERLDVEASRVDSVLSLHDTRLSQLESKIVVADSRLDNHDVQLAQHASQLTVHTSQITSLDSRLTISESQLALAQTNITTLQTQVSCIIATAAPGGGLTC